MKDHYLKQELYSLIQSDQTIFDFLQKASLDGLWYWDLDNPEEEWMSPEFWLTLGYDPEEMPHKASAWQDLIHPDDLEKAKQNLAAHLQDTNHPYDQLVRYRHKKGYTVWVRCRGLVVRDEANQSTRMLGAHNNVTKLKFAEDRLESENRQLNAVLANSGLYILNTDIEGKFTYFNDKFKKDFGWLPFIAIGKDSLPSIHPNDHKACTEAVEQCIQMPGQAVQVDLRKPKKDGGWQTNRWNFSAQYDDSDRIPKSILCIGYDISKKISLKGEYQMLVDNIGDLLVTTDLAGAIQHTSKSWSKYFQSSQDAAVGCLLVDYCYEDDRTDFHDFFTNIANGSLSASPLEHRLHSEEGTPLWVETKCNLDSNANRLIFLIRDIAERKEAGDKLQMSTTLLNETQRITQVGGWRLDVQTGQTIWTEEVYRIHEVPLDFEHNKQTGISFYHPDDQQSIADALGKTIEHQTDFDQSFKFISAKGNRKWVRVTGKPIIKDGKVTHVQGLFQDITEQTDMLNALSHSQGQLASLTANVPGTVLQYKLNPDQSDELLYISEGVTDIWGIEPEEVLKDINRLWETFLPSFVEGLRSAIETSAQHLSTFSCNWPVRHRDGSLKWVNGKGQPKRLPDGSTVWDTLITDITPLKKAQQKLMDQGLMQAKLMQIASEYINYPIEEMDDRIQSSLKEIGQFVKADRAYIIEYNFDNQTASNTHEWCAPSVEAFKDSLQGIPMAAYQPFIDAHLKGRYFSIPDVSEMEDSPAKKELQQQQIKSLITVPMMQEGRCLGCVGFDSVKQYHDYTEDELKLLELFSEVMLNTRLRGVTDRQLRSSREKLSKLTASVPGAIYQMEMDPEGNIAFPFVSEGIQGLHSELTPENLQADPKSAFSKVHPEDLPKILHKIEESRTAITPFFADYRVLKPDRGVYWHRAISHPERRANGTVVWYGIFQDITEQKQLEEIQQVAKELRVKNKELEQFTYVASHDLQEPLRTIRSYSGLLNQRFSDQLGKNGQQFLKFISDASLRMSNLIKGLLEYSQIGRDREVSEVDCNQLVSEVLQDLNSSIQQHDALIEVADLPTIEGYPVELRQLFQNLISNAIKFHKADQRPEAKVTATDKGDFWQFAVQDNGIGIHPMYQEKIFTLFQRLHQSYEYDGTGIGLAHCKKIVEMHHGQIWLESIEGKGATFFFTLKKEGYHAKTP